MKPPRGKINQFIVAKVAELPGSTRQSLESHTRAYGRACKEYFCGGGYFFQRLHRLCQGGYLTKLIVGGIARYYPRVDIPIEIDGKDRVALGVAADYVEEILENPSLAADMRKACRCVTKRVEAL